MAALIPLFCGMVLAGCVTQEEMFRFDDRLTAIEQRQEKADRERTEFRSLLEGYQSEDQDIRSRNAAIRVELDRLREETQQLNGRIEETMYMVKQRISALEDTDRKRHKELALLNEAVQKNRALVERIEAYLHFDKSESAVPARTPDTGPQTTGADEVPPEDKLYIRGKETFDNGDLESSRKIFAELIRKFPKSKHADNAQFWIGESYYRDQWYEKAILEYQKVIEKYPKGNKVQAALLKQGFAFLNLGDTANARLILKELIRRYPKSNEAAIAQKKLEALD